LRIEEEHSKSVWDPGQKKAVIKSAMATAAKGVYTHITKNPQVCGGKACIDNTRIRVMDIVELQREGHKPEDMRNVFAIPLTLAQIYSALAYADENPEEIEADFAEGLGVGAQIERDRTEYLQPKR
jgi:uncharacterized protein (DUF433 family)